ncbi:hypothetical protein KCU95_g18026, partial [Aureobasidium melanogenum]
MAIIPDVPHVAVDIVVDGNPLPEYLDEDDEDSVSPTSTIKYVESVSGSHFGIRVNLNGMDRRHLKRGNAIIVEYYLDGQMVSDSVFRFPFHGHSVYVRHGALYREGGIWLQRKFLFAALVTSEDVAHNKPRPELMDLGTITAKIYFSHAEGNYSVHGPDHTKIKLHENIHEKHLKGQAISQQARLEDAVATSGVQPIKARKLGDAFAVYNFRYRSRKDLQTLYLIPRSPSPIPLEDRPEGDLTREELLELLRRQKGRQEEQIKIKQELKRERIEDDEGDDDLVVLSPRPPAKQLKISTDADTGIDTIDLTDA